MERGRSRKSTFGLSGTDFRVCAVFNRGSRWCDCSGQICCREGRIWMLCTRRAAATGWRCIPNYERQESRVYVDGQTYLPATWVNAELK